MASNWDEPPQAGLSRDNKRAVMMQAVDFALVDSPNFRILVLIDNSAFAAAFSKFLSSAVFLTDLPYSSSGNGAHFLGGKNLEKLGLVFLVSTLLMEKCEKVSKYTGLGGLWEVI